MSDFSSQKSGIQIEYFLGHFDYFIDIKYILIHYILNHSAFLCQTVDSVYLKKRVLFVDFFSFAKLELLMCNCCRHNRVKFGCSPIA